MEQRHKSAIRCVYAELGKTLAVNKEFLVFFREDDVITEHMSELIMCKQTTLDRACAFLDFITKRGNTAFPTFIKALKSTGQSHLASKIDPNNEFAHITGQSYSAHHHAISPIAPPLQATENHPYCEPSIPSTGPQLFHRMPMTSMSPDFLMKLRDDPESQGAYKINEKFRGRAVILVNEIFPGRTKREGSEYDVQNLDQLFQHFNYETEIVKDKKAVEIREWILRESKRSVHHGADSFIMVCLSHGNRGNIFGTDFQEVSIDNDIVKHFDGVNCAALKDKPKLFFIQACQGDIDTQGQTVADGETSDYECINEVNEGLKKLKITDKPDANVLNVEATHEKSDIAQFYATVPGYRAWRNTAQGSWFVQDLVRTICACSHHMDLGRIAPRVNNEIKKRETDSRGFKQMSQFVTSLTKEFYFAK